MPDPIPTTVSLDSLSSGITLPVPCDPATQLFPVYKCVAGVWQLLLVDSEELGGYIGVDIGLRMKAPKQPCDGCDDKDKD